MSNNDKMIEDLRTKIKNKRKELGSKPSLNLKTNGLIHIDKTVKPININTLDLFSSIDLLGRCKLKQLIFDEAKEELNLPLDIPELIEIDDYIHDLKDKIKLIIWMEEKKKLQKMDDKLEHLLSEEAKTLNELNNINKELNL